MKDKILIDRYSDSQLNLMTLLEKPLEIEEFQLIEIDGTIY